MKLIIKQVAPTRLYIAGKMQPVSHVYYLSDGWRLEAETLKDARREAEMLGVEIERVEVEH